MFLFNSYVFSQSTKTKFTVVLDAGHGGKDPGNSYHGFVEKNIALKTTLKIGKLLSDYNDIRVIYTRTTDTFVELSKRPKIANNENANLFISIHCNSVNHFSPFGTETFVMGLSRSDMNLEVAKNENSVILLEKNYNQTYQGFNPNIPQSLIGFTLMQEENLNNSISLASKIQNNFAKNLNRSSRGVKQQPLWVLDAAYMPSVLIELGFLSNKKEGEFLNSNEGQEKMAKQIVDAIVSYKMEYFGQTSSESINKNSETVISSKNERKSNFDSSGNTIMYKVQLLASSQKISTNSKRFKGLNNISSTFENKIYRYTFADTASLDEARKQQNKAKKAGFSDAFILMIKDGKSIKLN